MATLYCIDDRFYSESAVSIAFRCHRATGDGNILVDECVRFWLGYCSSSKIMHHVLKFSIKFKILKIIFLKYLRNLREQKKTYFCKMVKIGNIELPDFPFLLAPMEDVSDPPFRRLCKLHGADLMYSEFISSEGLIRDAMKSRKKLDIFDYERPVGIQIFGGDEEAMSMSAKIVETVNPDIVDINFGCPVKKVVSKGAGAGVLKDVDLMV